MQGGGKKPNLFRCTSISNNCQKISVNESVLFLCQTLHGVLYTFTMGLQVGVTIVNVQVCKRVTINAKYDNLKSGYLFKALLLIPICEKNGSNYE